tara:strand:- start:138 stop:344 length:207 start_codon:yes stop_codon:yes gene_type:complete
MDITNATQINITSAKWVSDESTGNDQHSITFVVDGETWHTLNPNVGNRFFDEIMRQVEAGTLTIADAD